VKIGREQAIKVLDVHEFGVDFINHGFSEVLLEHSFVLFPQAS
jgi:hypothetical protein